MTEVPLVMMAASQIGQRQGHELYKEMQKRGWDVASTAVMAITADELDTARRRVHGAMDALKTDGLPAASNLHRSNEKQRYSRCSRCRKLSFSAVPRH